LRDRGSVSSRFPRNHAGAVFNISSGATVNISGLSIINGTGANAGGIYNAGALTVNYCVFTATMETTAARSRITLAAHCGSRAACFSNNSAVSNGGGAIGNYGALSVSASTFSGNVGGYGGGIENEGMATVGNSTFSGKHGAAMAVVFLPTSAQLSLRATTLSPAIRALTETFQTIAEVPQTLPTASLRMVVPAAIWPARISLEGRRTWDPAI